MKSASTFCNIASRSCSSARSTHSGQYSVYPSAMKYEWHVLQYSASVKFVLPHSGHTAFPRYVKSGVPKSDPQFLQMFNADTSELVYSESNGVVPVWSVNSGSVFGRLIRTQ